MRESGVDHSKCKGPEVGERRNKQEENQVPLWQRECVCMCGAESRETAVGNEVRKITERPQCAGL